MPALDWPALTAIDRKITIDVDQRLDVRAARRDKTAAERRLDAAQLAWLPTARIGVGYRFERAVLDAPFLEGDIVDADHHLGATLSITLPVWDWRRQDVLMARSELTRAEATEREALVRANSSVPAAFAAFEAATAAAERLRGVQGQITRALADVERGYEAGALSLDEALLARDRLLRAQLDSIDAERSRVTAHAALLRALSQPLLDGIEEAK